MSGFITEFTPLTHLYFYIAVVMMIVMWVVGRRQWRQIHRVIVRQFEDSALAVLAGTLAFVFAALYVAENHSAILHWFGGGGSAGRVAVVSVGLVFAWVVAFAMAWLVFYVIGRISGNAKNGKLHIQLDEFRLVQEARWKQQRHEERMHLMQTQYAEPRISARRRASQEPKMVELRPSGRK